MEDGASTPPRLEGVGTEQESEVEKIGCNEETIQQMVPPERQVNIDEVDLDVIGGGLKETTTAADIPEEVWLSIFRTLDHSDMQSCYRAIPKWKASLSYKRTSLLFREVAPLLLEELPREDMLNCRIACSAWKNGFDDAYQSHPQHLTLEPFDDPSEKAKRIPEFFPAMSAEGIQEFLRDMEDHPDNPFPGRRIELVCIGSPRDLPINFNGQLFRRSARQLMNNFGHHLYFADLYFTNLVRFGITAEQVLQDLLLRLPNLKRLHVTRQDLDGGFRMEGDPAVFENYPLPRLLHLESLSVVSYTGEHHDMISEMLSACCAPQNLKRLVLRSYDTVFNFRPCEQVYSFHNLEVLSLELTVEGLEKFGSLEQRPPLRQAVLNVVDAIGSSYQEVDFQQIFTAIETFSNSLEDVKVNVYGGFRGVFTMDPSSNYRVKLPKLKKLRLGNYEGPLEPLFQLSSLIHLKIRFPSVYTRAARAPGVYGIENRLYRNNIWDMLPCLKTFSVRRHYRVGYYMKRIYDRQLFECEMYDWQSRNNVKSRRQNNM